MTQKFDHAVAVFREEVAKAHEAKTINDAGKHLMTKSGEIAISLLELTAQHTSAAEVLIAADVLLSILEGHIRFHKIMTEEDRQKAKAISIVVENLLHRSFQRIGAVPTEAGPGCTNPECEGCAQHREEEAKRLTPEQMRQRVASAMGVPPEQVQVVDMDAIEEKKQKRYMH